MQDNAIERRPFGPTAALLLLIVAFVLSDWALQHLQAWNVALLPATTPRQTVARHALFAILLAWWLFAVILFLLRQRRQSLRDLGWGRPGRPWSWVGALLVAFLYAALVLSGPIGHNAPWLTDWSAYRLSLALGIGISAGFCEETVFRGFVMRQLADAGRGPTFQVICSAVLFSAAHVGWGALTHGGHLAAVLPALLGTAVLGCALAIVYLLSGRALAPVVAAHALIDFAIEPWLLLFAVTARPG